jgi:hypothetical protein
MTQLSTLFSVRASPLERVNPPLTCFTAWVLQDYTSKTLELSDPAVYREYVAPFLVVPVINIPA